MPAPMPGAAHLLHLAGGQVPSLSLDGRRGATSASGFFAEYFRTSTVPP